MEDVDVVAFVGVKNWHQPRTCVPGDPKFHGNNTTRFLRIKSEELNRVELDSMWSGAADSSGIGTHVKDCL